MSRSKRFLEELDTVGQISNRSKNIDFKDLPEPLQKSLGFLRGQVDWVSADARNYSVGTKLHELDSYVVSNLAQLGKHLASINTKDNSIVVNVKKDVRSY